MKIKMKMKMSNETVTDLIWKWNIIEIWKDINPSTTLYDLIYTPRPTNWLKLGKELGCQTIDGLDMLIQQGAASLKIWSSCEVIPTKAMRASAEDHLYT